MKKFGDWLSDQLKERDMIPADLTRLTGLESGVLSNLINNKRTQPSVDTSKRIAKALNLPLEEVYRAAEILPPKPEIDLISERLLKIVLDLPHEDKEDVLKYAELRHELATERQNVASVTKRPNRRVAPT